MYILYCSLSLGTRAPRDLFFGGFTPVRGVSRSSISCCSPLPCAARAVPVDTGFKQLVGGRLSPSLSLPPRLHPGCKHRMRGVSIVERGLRRFLVQHSRRGRLADHDSGRNRPSGSHGYVHTPLLCKSPVVLARMGGCVAVVSVT